MRKLRGYPRKSTMNGFTPAEAAFIAGDGAEACRLDVLGWLIWTDQMERQPHGRRRGEKNPPYTEAERRSAVERARLIPRITEALRCQ
jgi:hypothetical protein